MPYDKNNTRIFWTNSAQVQTEILPNMPTPLLDINEESILVGGNVWGSKKNISLKGEYVLLSGQQGFNLQRYLLTVLANNFGQLTIYDNFGQSNQIVDFQENNVYVQSIDFPQSRYLGIGNYDIKFYSYPSGFFTNYGVLDVKDEWGFEENGDYLLNLTRTYGARGFNTTSGTTGDSYNNAYDNAYNFALNYINNTSLNPISGGSNTVVLPQFITNKNQTLGYVPFLVSREEKANRFKGEYFVTEKYQADLFYNQLGVMRFKVNVNEPFAGFRTCEIDGDFIGSRNSSFAILRSTFLAFDFTDTALTNEPLINPATLQKSISENQLSKIIKFNFKYNSDKQQNIIQDITTSLNAEIDLDEIKVEGTIYAKKMSTVAWSGVSGAFAALNPYDIATTEYAINFANAGLSPLNPVPRSQSVSQNINTNTIKFSYTYDNELSYLADFETLSVKKSVKVPTRIIKPIYTIDNAGYVFMDLGIDKPKEVRITVNGTAKETTADSTAESEIQALLSGYISSPGELINNSQTSNNQKQFSYNQTIIYPTQASLTNFTGVVL